jgi:catechol 2,3-dioxygenase-like lactoylglutathione lyase family enzyme
MVDKGAGHGARVHRRPDDRERKGELMRIGITGIFVDDQDRAERFYTEVLGLQIKTNAPYGPDERWLTVVSPEEPDGVELALHLTDEPARAFREASRDMGRPVVSLRTDDCRRDAERLKAKGVVFVREPARMEYGGMDAVFDDTCGNLVNLHQD